MLKKCIITCCVVLMLFASNSKLEYNSSAAENEEVSIEFTQKVPESAPVSEHLKVMLDLVNKERIENNLEPLKWDGELYLAALTRAQEVSTNWSTTRPDGTPYFTISKLVKAENIVKGCKTPEEAITALINSEVNKESILDKNKTIIGIALYIHNGEYYWVQELG